MVIAGTDRANTLKTISQNGDNESLSSRLEKKWLRNYYVANAFTVVPVMNGHPRDQAKVSVHCRWPLVTGTDGQAGDAKYDTHCNNTYYYHHQRYS